MGTQPQTTTVSEIYGIGPANINFNDSWVGATQGGSEVNITIEKYKQTIDSYGSTPIKQYELATNIVITTRLKQETIARICHLCPSATNATTKATFGRYVGTEITGRRLILLPFDDAAHDIIVYSAVPDVNWNLIYSNEGERVYETKFEGMIDESRADNDKLFRLDQSYSI